MDDARRRYGVVPRDRPQPGGWVPGRARAACRRRRRVRTAEAALALGLLGRRARCGRRQWAIQGRLCAPQPDGALGVDGADGVEEQTGGRVPPTSRCRCRAECSVASAARIRFCDVHRGGRARPQGPPSCGLARAARRGVVLSWARSASRGRTTSTASTHGTSRARCSCSGAHDAPQERLRAAVVGNQLRHCYGSTTVQAFAGGRMRTERANAATRTTPPSRKRICLRDARHVSVCARRLQPTSTLGARVNFGRMIEGWRGA